MKFLMGIYLAFCFAMQPNIAKAEQKLLLNLQYKSDTTTTKEIKVYGDEIDPNIQSIDNNFSLTINQRSVELPDEFYRRINSLRRSFSYDALSGGIQQPEKDGPICRLGGSAQGMILETRYLTYENNSIVSSEMLPVFGLAQNCLFMNLYKPINLNAQKDARAVIEILNTLILLDY